MTREIRFRAWDRKNKKMCGVKMISERYLWTDDIWIDNHANLNETCHEMGVTCDVMQFTGLKDKNGMDIYEGDILKDNYERKSAVEYNEASFSPFDWGDESFTDKFCEVVGNIYENPELLK